MEIILCFSGGPRVFPGLPLQCHIALSEWLHSSQLWSCPEDWPLRPEPPPLAPTCCRLTWACELLLSCEVTFSKISVANFLKLWRSPQSPVWRSFLICGVQVPIPNSFVSHFVFIFCSTSFQGDWFAFLKVWGPLSMFSKCSVEIVPQADGFLIYLWRRRWSHHSIPLSSWKFPLLAASL